jgi:hypothetical protein
MLFPPKRSEIREVYAVPQLVDVLGFAERLDVVDLPSSLAVSFIRPGHRLPIFWIIVEETFQILNKFGHATAQISDVRDRALSKEVEDACVKSTSKLVAQSRYKFCLAQVLVALGLGNSSLLLVCLRPTII